MSTQFCKPALLVKGEVARKRCSILQRHHQSVGIACSLDILLTVTWPLGPNNFLSLLIGGEDCGGPHLLHLRAAQPPGPASPPASQGCPTSWACFTSFPCSCLLLPALAPASCPCPCPCPCPCSCLLPHLLLLWAAKAGGWHLAHTGAHQKLELQLWGARGSLKDHISSIYFLHDLTNCSFILRAAFH